MLKLRMRFRKEGFTAFISHLDLMRTMQRSFARAGLNASHTEGFNPHVYVSMVLPLSVGHESVTELMDFEYDGEPPVDFVEKMNAALPPGIVAEEVYEGGLKSKFLAKASYDLRMFYDNGTPPDAAEKIEKLFQAPVIIEKRSKRGFGETDIAPLVYGIKCDAVENGLVAHVLVAAGATTLNPAYLATAIEKYLPEVKPDFVKYLRTGVFTAEGEKFR